MISFCSKDGQFNYEIWWSKDGEIKFTKNCVNLKLEDYDSWQEYLKARKSAMETWSTKRAKQEEFKKNIVDVLEQIVGSKRNNNDIRFAMSKTVWKKLKDGTANKNDFHEHTLFNK